MGCTLDKGINPTESALSPIEISSTYTITPTKTATATPSPTSTVTSTITPTPSPSSTPTPSPTPMGGGIPCIAFIGNDEQGNYSLYIENLNTNEYTAVVPISYEENVSQEWVGPIGRWGNISIGWSPDGSQIVFNTGAYVNDSLRLLDVNTGEVTELAKIPNGSWISRIAWSPINRSLVAYEQAKSGGSSIRPSIWIANTDNNQVLSVADTSEYPSMIGWSPDANALYYFNGSNTMSYNPVTQSKKEMDQPKTRLGGRYILGSPPKYLPEIDAFLDIPGTNDPNCPWEYLFYFKDETAPKSICGIGYHYPSTESISPDKNWLFIRGNIYLHESAYLVDLNTLTLKELGDSIIWLLGWTPDNTGFITVMYTDEGREINDQLMQEYGTLTGAEYRNRYQEYLSEFDSQLPKMLQIAIINANTGDLEHIYPFPSTIRPMIKVDNLHSDDGKGLGISWLTQP